MEYDGELLEIANRKGLALLTYLAINPEIHRRNRLAGLFWPDYNQTRARANLRRTFWILNQTPLANLIGAGQESIHLESGDELWVDVIRFRELLDVWCDPEHLSAELTADALTALSEAIAIYQRDFLADFYLPDSNEFENWTLAQREQLRQQMLRALAALASHHIAQGYYEAAQSNARRQLEIDNLQESAYQQLMTALARNGQRNAALAQYEECRRLFFDELGVGPSEETTAVYQRIRADASASIPPLEPVVAPPQPRQLATDPSLERSPANPYRGLLAFREEDAPFFFGREAFTELLLEAVHQQSLAAVVGLSGSGKSSVVHAGLLAELRIEGNWLIASFRPGSRPFQALAAALLPELEKGLTEIEQLVETDKLAIALMQGDVSLISIIRRILSSTLYIWGLISHK